MALDGRQVGEFLDSKVGPSLVGPGGRTDNQSLAASHIQGPVIHSEQALLFLLRELMPGFGESCLPQFVDGLRHTTLPGDSEAATGQSAYTACLLSGLHKFPNASALGPAAMRRNDTTLRRGSTGAGPDGQRRQGRSVKAPLFEASRWRLDRHLPRGTGPIEEWGKGAPATGGTSSDVRLRCPERQRRGAAVDVGAGAPGAEPELLGRDGVGVGPSARPAGLGRLAARDRPVLVLMLTGGAEAEEHRREPAVRGYGRRHGGMRVRGGPCARRGPGRGRRPADDRRLPREVLGRPRSARRDGDVSARQRDRRGRPRPGLRDHRTPRGVRAAGHSLAVVAAKNAQPKARRTIASMDTMPSTPNAKASTRTASRAGP